MHEHKLIDGKRYGKCICGEFLLIGQKAPENWEDEMREFIDKCFIPKDKNGMKNLDREIIISKIRSLLQN